MARSRLTLALVALLVVAGLGLAATALDVPTGESGGGDQGSPRQGGDVGRQTQSDQSPILAIIGIIVAVATLLVIGYLLYNGVYSRHVAALVVVTLVVFAMLILLAYLLPESSGDARLPAAPSSGDVGSGAGSGGGSAGGTAIVAPVTTLVLFGAVVLVGLVLVAQFTRRTGGRSTVEADASEPSAAVGRAAGDAADELASDAELSNAVYRAWREMTDPLDVDDPETTTPAEFAAAAVDAGLDREDVDTLTQLFREVRYGDSDVTPERADRARRTLRRIEAAYTDDSTEDSDDRTGNRGEGW